MTCVYDHGGAHYEHVVVPSLRPIYSCCKFSFVRPRRAALRDVRVGAEAAEHGARRAPALARHQVRLRQRPTVGDRHRPDGRQQQPLGAQGQARWQLPEGGARGVWVDGAPRAPDDTQEPAQPPLRVAALQQPGDQRLWGLRRGRHRGQLDGGVQLGLLGAGGHGAPQARRHRHVAVRLGPDVRAPHRGPDGDLRPGPPSQLLLLEERRGRLPEGGGRHFGPEGHRPHLPLAPGALSSWLPSPSHLPPFTFTLDLARQSIKVPATTWCFSLAPCAAPFRPPDAQGRHQTLCRA